MIAEALKLLLDTAADAAGSKDKATVLPLPLEPRIYAVVSPDGSVEYRSAAPPIRQHKIHGIDEVAGFVQFTEDDLSNKPTVWFSGSGVSVVMEDTDTDPRDDRATVKLERTQAHATLAAIGKSWFPQKEFVRLLRITLADAATDETLNLLRVVRVLSFSESIAGHGKIEHGRQSLGRDIEAEVKSDAGELPETVAFNVRLYTDPGLTQRFQVVFAVDVNPKDGTFNLSPLGESLTDAVDAQVEAIGERLRAAVKCPVFRGEP